MRRTKDAGNYRVPLCIAEVAANLAPSRPHVDNLQPSAGAANKAMLPPVVAPAVTSFQRERNRTRAVDALHTYIVEAVDYDHRRAETLLARVITTLDNQLGAHTPSGAGPK